jgi:hypothetical protein
MNSFLVETQARANRVNCTEDTLQVHFTDGRTISAPLICFPRLHKATAEELKDWRLLGGGLGIHWTQLDEDIGVAALLEP